MRDEQTDDTLHCAHHGWHPAIDSILERLELLTGRGRAEFRQLLIDRTGAREVHDHLVGCVVDAVDVLHAAELDALRALYALDSTRS